MNAAQRIGIMLLSNLWCVVAICVSIERNGWIDFETIIALASMTYIVDLDAYELHPVG